MLSHRMGVSIYEMRLHGLKQSFIFVAHIIKQMLLEASFHLMFN